MNFLDRFYIVGNKLKELKIARYDVKLMWERVKQKEDARFALINLLCCLTIYDLGINMKDIFLVTHLPIIIFS